MTSRVKDLTLEKEGLDILEQSRLYTPVYTVPQGWNTPMNEALEALTRIELRKGIIPRTVYYDFPWSELDWRIFEIMSDSVRTKIAYLAREIHGDYSTAKHHFFDVVVPCCVIAHYFFPKGYSSYFQSFIKVSSDYEVEMVKAFENLPCTTYVFPLEKELVINLFHENQKNMVTLLEKMEEKTVIDSFLLYNPLYSVYPDFRPSDEE